MVGSEFLDFADKFRLASYVGVEDFADKLNFLYTVVILLLCTTIISVKQYLLKAIACYIPNVPSGSDFDDYVESYCWVHGTIALRPDQSTPQDGDWDKLDQTHRINYYQWVPFMLGIQCILFYAPRILWQTFCYNRTGTDLESIVSLATSGVHAVGDERKATVQHISRTLEDMFFHHRDFRRNRFRRPFYNYCKMCMISKRLGTWLIVCYLIIKILYLANAVGQMFLMKTFLGFNSSINNFGVDLMQHIVDGRDWRETLFFPRVTFCNVNNVRQVGAQLRFTAQCALPVNMFNEKIYIFLWFWMAIVCVFTAISIPVWIYRIGLFSSRVRFIKKFLRVSDCYEHDNPKEKNYLNLFVKGFLRHDGVFLVRMISLNAGDLITTEVVTCLWVIFKTKYPDVDLRAFHDANEPAHRSDEHVTLPLGDPRTAKTEKPKFPDPYADKEDGEFV